MTMHLESGTCESGITRQIVDYKVRSRDEKPVINQRPVPYSRATGGVDLWATNAAYNGRYYECYICSKGFLYITHLNQHLQSRRYERTVYHCSHCGTEFALFISLIQHVESETCGISRFRGAELLLTSNPTCMITC